MEVNLSKTFEAVYTIPKGTSFTPGNGLVFELEKDLAITPGSLKGEGKVICKTPGTIGNDYTPGQINVLMKPIAYVTEVKNIQTSFGGAEAETAESYRERIRLAPSSYSTAGDEDSYKLLAKSYGSTVSDVSINSPTPGQVDIIFSTENGIPSTDEIASFQDYLNNTQGRPLTDKLVAGGPVAKDFTIDLTYYISSSDKLRETEIKTMCEGAADDYKVWQSNAIGRHINPSELHRLLTKAGASMVLIAEPTATDLLKTELANCTQVNLNYGGLRNDQID